MKASSARSAPVNIRYRKLSTDGALTVEATPSLVRYADDCVPRTLKEASM
jgi:hypothetical protein